MDKPTKKPPKATRLSSLSQKYVPDDFLADAPARLFRQILHKMDMDVHKWSSYLRNYLEWMVPASKGERDKVKSDRTTRTGNIKDTYFQKDTLTLNKFLEGLSILRMRSCEIIIRATDENGKVIEVSEVLMITGKDRGDPITFETPPDE